jgi:alkylhydroperoxidase family enzyme
VSTPYDAAIERLRSAAEAGGPSPAEMAPYLEKVRNSAYSVIDRDLDELRALGISEDEIFEQTVSTAVTAGLARLAAALRVVA